MPTRISRLWKFNTDDKTATWFFTGTWIYRRTWSMDVKFVALKTVCDIILLSRKGSSCSLCVTSCVCFYEASISVSIFMLLCFIFYPSLKATKKLITNLQHCRAKLRARCLRSSWHILPIDGSVITVACRGHIMAASDSLHSGPVSYKSSKRGWRGIPPPLSCWQISRTWNQARNSQVLNVESPAKRRQAKRN